MPADRARRDLAKLRESGTSIRRISQATGIPIGTLQHVARADRRHVTLTTQERLTAAAAQG